MSSLAKILVESEYNAKINSATLTVSAQQYVERAQLVRKKHQHLKGQRVALVFQDMHSFTLGLIALDGFCAEIYLCSAELATNISPALCLWPDEAFDVSSDVIDESYAPLCHSDADTSLFLQQQTPVTNWFLASSGTSGEPKWFAHNIVNLTRHIKVSERLHALCWANFYQPFRYAGLQVLLQVLVSGATLIDAISTDLVSQLHCYSNSKVNAISATPSMWRQLLMTNRLPMLTLENITLGGEIVDQAILDQLHHMFPAAKLRHIYASTEVGVGFVVADKKAGFPAQWLQNEVSGAALMIDEAHHLRIKPRCTLDKKLASDIDENGYLDTQDLVQTVGDRVFFQGRASGAINVGGNKVHPEKVESVILAVSGVQHARVYSQANSVLGALVAADIVISDDFNWTDVSGDVRQQCKLQLQRFEIPVKLRKIDSLEINSAGKINRSSNNV